MQQNASENADGISEPANGTRKSRRWVFTINNPRVPYPQALPRRGRYLVYQLERGANGTPHLQGYAEFEDNRRLGEAAKCFEGDYAQPQPRGHWEIARGTAEQCKAYCSKPATRIGNGLELGAAAAGQGARTDLRAAAAEVARTGRVDGIAPDMFVKYSTGFMRLAATVTGPYRPGLRIVTLCGPTEVGKSYAVRARYKDPYVPYYGNGGLWWDGYRGQEVALFEEFAGQVQLQKMLQILDPYPTQVECKGGSYAARFTLLFITCNRPPEQWYENKDGQRSGELQALYRRLGSIANTSNRGRYIEAVDRESLNSQLDAALAGAVPAPDGGGLGAPAVPAPAGASEPPQQAQAVQMASPGAGDGGGDGDVDDSAPLNDTRAQRAAEMGLRVDEHGFPIAVVNPDLYGRFLGLHQ